MSADICPVCNTSYRGDDCPTCRAVPDAVNSIADAIDSLAGGVSPLESIAKSLESIAKSLVDGTPSEQHGAEKTRVSYQEVDKLCNMASEIIGAAYHPADMDSERAWVERMRKALKSSKLEIRR